MDARLCAEFCLGGVVALSERKCVLDELGIVADMVIPYDDSCRSAERILYLAHPVEALN